MGSSAAATAPVTVAYGTQSPLQAMDVYRPASGPAALVVYVHGGGWGGGDKSGGTAVAATLTAAGYVVASVNYRLVGAGTTVADAAGDVAHAAAFLLAHAAAYGIDPRRFALAGHSAGGHLVALMATDPEFARAAGLDLSRLGVMVALDGVFDLTGFPAAGVIGDAAARRAASPVFQVSEVVGHPLFCLVHETALPVFGAQADAFAAALRTAGQRVTESLVPNLPHPALAALFGEAGTPMAGEAEECLKEGLLF